MLRHGWRTGAIVPELETEIRIINTEQYMHSLTWQQALTGLLERMQVKSSCLSRARSVLSVSETGAWCGDQRIRYFACVLKKHPVLLKGRWCRGPVGLGVTVEMGGT